MIDDHVGELGEARRPRGVACRCPLLAGTLLALAAVGWSASGAVAAEPSQPATASYTNPVFQPAFADPTVFHDPVSGEYFAYGTTDQWGSSVSTLHILPILESSDLAHWSFVHDTFSPDGSPAAADEPPQPSWTDGSPLWRASVDYIDGRYVMYYTASSTTSGGSAIGVATASSPTGPWQDSGGPLVAPRPDGQGGYYWTYDPDQIQSAGGQRYLYYGSFYGGTFVVPLEPDGLAVEPGAMGQQVGAAGRFEGTFVIAHDGYYYLFAASGNCCAGPNTGYDVFVTRSRSPLGPFVDQLGIPMTEGGGTIVLASNGDSWTGPGGVRIVPTAGGQHWMVFHAVDQTSPYLPDGATRRPMLLEPVEWTGSGWPEVDNGNGPQSGPQPAPLVGNGGPATIAPAGAARTPGGPGSLTMSQRPGRLLPEYSQTFDTAQLASQWTWVNEDTTNWSLSSDPGTLTIDGQSGQFYETEHDGQNVLLEKAPPGNFVVQTQVAIDPTENYQQAGLVLWQDDDTWMKLVGESNSGVDETEWGKQTDVTSPYAGFDCGSGYPADTCPVYGSGFLEAPGFSPAAAAVGGSGTSTWLRIVRDGDLVTAYTSIDGTSWTPGATYNLSGFGQGAQLEIGVMASAAGASAPIPAHFSYVDAYGLANGRP